MWTRTIEQDCSRAVFVIRRDGVREFIWSSSGVHRETSFSGFVEKIKRHHPSCHSSGYLWNVL
ncbi:MAG: hypothetical protein CBE00_12035 [Planctomycetaceae bacterium TMED240]|nr:hypothetical protein [Rhodopirellula sp.]OUX04824.1 MAG: hypothetical protein CBE00_12035 [Planctomycetaceae bacterium TMED240]